MSLPPLIFHISCDPTLFLGHEAGRIAVGIAMLLLLDEYRHGLQSGKGPTAARRKICGPFGATTFENLISYR